MRGSAYPVPSAHFEKKRQRSRIKDQKMAGLTLVSSSRRHFLCDLDAWRMSVVWPTKRDAMLLPSEVSRTWMAVDALKGRSMRDAG